MSDMPDSSEASHAPRKAISHVTIWQIIVILLAIALAVSVITKGFTFTGAATAGVTAQQAGQKAISYINALMQGQATATLVNASEQNGIYKIDISIDGEETSVYVTKDGAMMLAGAYDLTRQLPAASSGSSNEGSGSSAGYPKSDKPLVELFVMSFCPYGVQAENAMKPVVDLLGDSADFKIKFIVNVAGTTPDSVQSLHGAPEAMEDLRQVCVRENYNQSTLWAYVSEINENCYSIYRNATAMDACWRAAAEEAGINATLVESCVNETAVIAISEDEADAEAYRVTGSPTLIINGQHYSGSRSSEAFKTAICSAFNTPPAACNQTLSSTASQASGGCGA